MGFFGSSKKTYYSSTSTKLYEEVPSLLSQSVASSITQNRDLSSDLIANLVNGIGFKANALYNYGLNGGYPYGLPDGSTGLYPPAMHSNVKLVIERELGVPIYLYSCTIDRDADTSNLVYYATYQLLNDRGEIIDEDPIEWSYDESTEVYDILTIQAEDELGNSPYFPIIPVRLDGVSQVEDGATYRAETIRAGNTLGVDIQSISDSMEEQEGENPVEDAFVVLGVEVASTEQISMRYLFEFFDLIHGSSKVTKEDYEYWEANEDSDTPPINSILMSDSSYNMELGWLYTEKDIVTGVKATVGEYATEYKKNDDDLIVVGLAYSTSSFTVYHQLTENQYVEVVVYGLVHSNWAVGKELRTTLADAFGESDDLAQCFIIPLRKDILNAIGTIHQHDLMYQAIRLVLNDKNVVKLKWYQTGFFEVFTMIVAIVISIYYPPFGLAVGSAAACGMAVATVLAAKILLPVVIKALDDILGAELALLVAVVASAWMGDFSNASMVSGAMQLVGGINTLRFESALADITKELEEIGDLLDEQAEEEAELQAGITFALNTATSDNFNILAAHDYVKKTHYDVQEPTLIRTMTEHYTDVSRYLDKPDSMIRLGQTL